MTTPRYLGAGAAIAALAISLAACGAQSTSAVVGSAKASAPAPAATTAAAPPDAAGGAITVKLSEWAVAASASTAPHGKVTFDITNTGRIAHELVVLRTSRPAGALGTGTRIKETTNVGEQGDLAAGASKKLTLMLKPGHYSLVCNLPEHYMSGMHADFTVQ